MKANAKRRTEVESGFSEVSLEISSGEIVFGDWLGNSFALDYQENLNCLSGRIKTTLDYGKNSLFHGCVGNSCPAIFYDKESGIISIANQAYENSQIKGDNVGCIITDLWWYSLADREEYIKRGGSKKTNFFKVQPGTYLLKHFHYVNSDSEKDVVYATISLSNKKPKNIALPEDKMQKTLTSILVKDFGLKKKKFDLKVLPHYDYKNSTFLGYKVDYVERPFTVDSDFGEIVFQDLSFEKNPCLIAKKLIADVKKRKKTTDFLNKVSKQMENKEELSESTRKKIRKYLERSSRDSK